MTRDVPIEGTRYPYGDLIEVGPFRLRFDVRQPSKEVLSGDDSPAEIMIVAQGWAMQLLDSGEQLCSSLSVSYRPPHYPKRDRIGDAGVLAIRVSVRPAFAREVDRDYFGGNRGPLHFPCGALDDVPARLISECLRADAASPIMIDGLLRQLVGNAARYHVSGSQQKAPSWLDRGAELLERSYRDAPKIEDVARAVGVDPGHFSRVFHRLRRISAKHFVLLLRLQEGASMLATTSTPICDIAAALGFCDQAHFTREFKKWAGAPPDTFRRARTKLVSKGLQDAHRNASPATS